MPYSSITALMKGSASLLLTPADWTYSDLPKKCFASASAMGERTAFCEHMNRTLWIGRPDAPATTDQPFQCRRRSA